MSAKLVVHKFESDISLKSLQINIEDGDNGFFNTKYSEWFDGKAQQKKKVTQKSRLVVKIVSGSENNNFNLDSCAKQIEDSEIWADHISHRVTFNKINETLPSININDNASLNQIYYKSERNNYTTDILDDINDEDQAKGIIKPVISKSLIDQQEIVSNSTLTHRRNSMSPLEYSLEKVKENNARIMESIHVLNRTLSYTKKKEILDIVCPKTMRYPCNICGKCFVYKTGLKRHYSMRHAMSEIQPRWQVVWTCIECFQVWPRQDLAIEHSNECCKTDNIDCVREIKTSSLLQCEFCEKVYTSIPRLLRHSKTHSTASNYECNACELSFPSYKAAERHWVLCPWLKLCYGFSLPKLLLCNACDRKFRNYEQLYNHRYKVGHFMTKVQCNKGSVKSLSILLYQCEICSQSLPSITSLQAHRTQQHSGYECYDTEMRCQMDKTFTEYDNAHYQTVAEPDPNLNKMLNVNAQKHM